MSILCTFVQPKCSIVLLEERTHAGLMSLLPSRGTTGLMDSGISAGVPVLKLHGSVDWKRGNDGEIVLVDSGELLKSEIETPLRATRRPIVEMRQSRR